MPNKDGNRREDSSRQTGLRERGRDNPHPDTGVEQTQIHCIWPSVPSKALQKKNLRPPDRTQFTNASHSSSFTRTGGHLRLQHRTLVPSRPLDQAFPCASTNILILSACLGCQKARRNPLLGPPPPHSVACDRISSSPTTNKHDTHRHVYRKRPDTPHTSPCQP